MKRNRKRTATKSKSVRPWTYSRAKAAAPYLASVLRSLREHRLEALRHRLLARRLADAPGRPTRDEIIAQEEALREAHLAEERYQEARDELQAIDVFCSQPIHGRALIPFAHNDQLAWYIYDIYEKEPLRYWKFHSDPNEIRRAITPEQQVP